MPLEEGRRAEGAGGAREASGRRAKRLPIGDLLVAVDAPEVAAEPWVVDAFDINSLGLGLVLPPELAEGTGVFLSFRLAEEVEFSRLPAVVSHQLGVSGGVRFESWPSEDRLRLLEYLVEVYEDLG